MKRRWIALLCGVVAGGIMAAAWFGAPYTGLHLQPATLVAMAAILAFAASTATFALMAFDRPAFRDARATLNLDEKPATRFIFPFKSDKLAQIFMKPETPLAMALARFGNTFDLPAPEMNKGIIVTLRGSKKTSFPTTTLQQLFKVLKSFKLEHVLMLDESGEFVAYIPGARALREFTGDNAAEKITKYIANVLDHPDRSDAVREVGGAGQSDTIKNSQDIGDAEKELWKNESAQGLVVLHKLKPIGYISRLDVLTLHAGQR